MCELLVASPRCERSALSVRSMRLPGHEGDEVTLHLTNGREPGVVTGDDHDRRYIMLVPLRRS
jgi:hypothetical protein